MAHVATYSPSGDGEGVAADAVGGEGGAEGMEMKRVQVKYSAMPNVK